MILRNQKVGVKISSIYKAVKWVEDTLVTHLNFALSGRKALMKSDTNYEVVLIDTTESPIERPKKNKNSIIQERRKGIHQKLK
ncbi:IS5 family transposase ISOt6 [Orientia tsutsugamushi]|uniref:IS5 family transposase ISOt6 n=1 Tax=Orientia tsutsugamushi TaxID=784 RepID=A0A2U3QN59_ORITS|nr:DDE superendonuclease family protein [Orientia tsutsugamushi str. UT76]SPR02367.1 IS5 family transposase ISOt6 [Orientia tsutsugamushi]